MRNIDLSFDWYWSNIVSWENHDIGISTLVNGSLIFLLLLGIRGGLGDLLHSLIISLGLKLTVPTTKELMEASSSVEGSA